jgi:hypothetical protein
MIVVIDDSCRFPLHVWRYMSRSLGVGIGEVEREGIRHPKDLQAETWISQGKPLFTSDGNVGIWWVSADDHWSDGVRRIAAQSRESRLMFLVDVHGKRKSKYNVLEVCNYIKSRQIEPYWYPVSAYYSGNKIEGEEVLPKTRETLAKIRKDILGKNGKHPEIEEGLCHLLVTGAGFEIRSAQGGFGLPLTRDLLKEMDSPFFYCDTLHGGTLPESHIYLRSEGEEGKGEAICFPVPFDGIWKDKSLGSDIIQAAKAEDLDDYWDILLGEELRSQIGSSAKHGIRDLQKTEALIWEARMREAFRRSLLQYDWGHMNQSISAADLDWHSWLTTNYTQFANRAIAARGSDERPWRIISTAAEARITLRENARGLKQSRNKYLFKLHGDIGHLHTMAIAGNDKDIFSPLSMPVEDLYQVYSAARSFLLDSLGNQETKVVVWHIVGHGLQDKRLCDLIGMVCQQKGPRHLFMLVNPNPKDPKERLRDSVGRRHKIHACRFPAGEYMARLENKGLPPNPDASEEWGKEVVSLAESARRNTVAQP